jgi:hypothetical protein
VETSEKPGILVESKATLLRRDNMIVLDTLPMTVAVVTAGRAISRSVSAETVTAVESVKLKEVVACPLVRVKLTFRL